MDRQNGKSQKRSRDGAAATTIQEMMRTLFTALLLPFLPSILLPSTVHAQSLNPADVQNITYPADVSTCANKAVRLHLVMVQPNCDMAISTLCSRVNASIASSDALINLRAVGDIGFGPCEAQILFRDFEPGPSGYDYDDCVKAFQSITIDCMLISVGKEAAPGKQGGVRAVAFDPAENFTAALTTSPGYLVAQPDYFPQNNTTELEVPGNA
ncbi:MAG: hypothetical protein Q9173_005590 [Seirophora scorigena]